MSGVYAYCVTPPGDGDEPAEVAGIGDVPVFLRPCDPLVVWLSALDARPRASVETVRGHNAVVEAAWRTRPACVPFRFGQWFGSSEEAGAAVVDHLEDLVEATARVEGMAEFGVRVLSPAPAGAGPEATVGGAEPGDGPGTAHLRSLRREHAVRAARERKGEEVRRALRSDLDGIVSEDRTAPSPSPEGLVDLAHLVPRSLEERYRTALDRAARRLPDATLLVTGPWPPYSFGP